MDLSISTSPAIKYRQLVAADFAVYRMLRLECLKRFPNNFGSLYEEEYISGPIKLKKAIKSPDSTNFVIGAFLPDKQMIGACGLVTGERKKISHRGEIVQMYVSSAYSGRGIGAALLRQIIEIAFGDPKLEQLMLGVVESNEKAIALYASVGFTVYGRFENYFKAADKYETLLLMKLLK